MVLICATYVFMQVLICAAYAFLLALICASYAFLRVLICATYAFLLALTCATYAFWGVFSCNFPNGSRRWGFNAFFPQGPTQVLGGIRENFVSDPAT